MQGGETDTFWSNIDFPYEVNGVEPNTTGYSTGIYIGIISSRITLDNQGG